MCILLVLEKRKKWQKSQKWTIQDAMSTFGSKFESDKMKKSDNSDKIHDWQKCENNKGQVTKLAKTWK